MIDISTPCFQNAALKSVLILVLHMGHSRNEAAQSTHVTMCPHSMKTTCKGKSAKFIAGQKMCTEAY